MADVEALLALAADIERRDGDVARALELVLDLGRRADAIKSSAAHLQRLLESAPGDIAALDRSEAEARDAWAETASALAHAERRVLELAQNRRASAEALAAADRDLELSRELAAGAAARVDRLVHDKAELIRAESAAHADAFDLVRDANDVASRLQSVQRVSASGREAPGQDLEQLSEWGSRVRAALFVVRGQLEGERDRLVREANELGSAVLGEQLAGSNVTLVRRRLEEVLRP